MNDQVTSIFDIHVGMRIFYTDQLREHDTGLLLMGTEVNFLHWIPPFQDSFTTVGRCTAECTQQVLTLIEIKFIAAT